MRFNYSQKRNLFYTLYVGPQIKRLGRIIADINWAYNVEHI